MKNLTEYMESELPVSLGKEKCKVCGEDYNIWKHKGRIVKICKLCSDNEVRIKYNIPTISEYKKEKQTKSILYFEKISDDLKDVTVNSYHPKNETQTKAKLEVVKFVKSFDENKNQSLVLSGGVGLGKSHLAYATIKALRNKGYNALFIKTTHLMEYIKKTFRNSGDWGKFEVGAAQSEDGILELISSLDIIALDDMGSEYVKLDEYGHESWASDILFRIYESRLGKATITTTNYSDREMKLKYGNNGPRIIDRMIDNAIGVRLEGESFRREKNKSKNRSVKYGNHHKKK